MQFRDTNGHLIQYGDIVEDLRTHSICRIIHSSLDDTPVLFVLKRFSWQRLTYEEVEHKSANACYEQRFIPKHSGLYWFLHGKCLPHIELMQHGSRNRRIKEI